MNKSLLTNRTLILLITTILILSLCLTVPYANYSYSDKANSEVFAASKIENPSNHWINSHGENNSDEIRDVIQLSDGSYITIGQSTSNSGDLINNFGGYDFIISKYDQAGKKLWIKNYGGSGNDRFNCIVPAQGGFVAVGNSASNIGSFFSNKGGYDAVIAKFNYNGEILWMKSFGGNGDDVFNSVCVAPDGGFVAAGYTRSTNDDLSGKALGSLLVVKYSADGTKDWARTFGGSSATEALGAVTNGSSGGYIVVGSSSSNDGDLSGKNIGMGDFVIAEIRSTGSVEWIKNYGGTLDESFGSVIAAHDGGYIAVGSSYSKDNHLSTTRIGRDFVIAKFDTKGNKEWIKNYGGNGTDLFLSVIPAQYGGYIAVGNSNSNDIDLSKNMGSYDMVIAKFDNKGNKVWMKNFGGEEFDSLVSVIPSIGGGYTAVGNSRSSGGDIVRKNTGTSDNFVIAKFHEKYNVIFHVNGGNKLGTSSASKIVIHGSTHGKLPVPKKKGHKFLGWFTKITGGEIITEQSTVTIAQDMTLFAHWKANKYKVTFVNDKGKKIKSKKVTFGKKYGKLPKVSKSGKKFAGWYTKKKGGTKITAKSKLKYAKNIKLYPHWK